MRRILAGTGRVLITVGLLILAFVAYQLWGTGVLQARAQSDLENQFEQLRVDLDHAAAELPAGPTTATAPPSNNTTDEELDPAVRGDDDSAADSGADEGQLVDLSGLPQLTPGDPLGRMTIEAAGVDEYFVVGVGRDELKKGPGHYPGTPVPGSLGLSAIAGHRTTYGAPFFDLDNVEMRGDPDSDRPDLQGDTIVTETLAGTHVYEVIAKRVVAPNETWVAAPVGQPIDAGVPQTSHNWAESYALQQQLWYPESEPGEIPALDPDGAYLVLTTCNPKYSAAERLVVLAELTTDEHDDVEGDEAVTVALPGVEKTAEDEPTAEPVTLADLPNFEGAQSFEQGLGGDASSLSPAILWGLAATLVGLAWWWAFRRWRHPLTWFVGFLPFAIVVLGCFVYVERLLPSGY